MTSATYIILQTVGERGRLGCCSLATSDGLSRPSLCGKTYKAPVSRLRYPFASVKQTLNIRDPSRRPLASIVARPENEDGVKGGICEEGVRRGDDTGIRGVYSRGAR